MIQLDERSFSCVPCRQTVRVYAVERHRYLRSIEPDHDVNWFDPDASAGFVALG